MFIHKRMSLSGEVITISPASAIMAAAAEQPADLQHCNAMIVPVTHI